MFDESTHPSLLDRVRDTADQAAWREFDERYRELILRYGQRRGLQPADVEDVRQVVMMKLTQRLPAFTYRPEVGRFRDYLGTVVRHAIIKHQANRRRGAEVLVENPAEAGGPAIPDEDWHDEWMLHHYRRGMMHIRATFPEKSLEIFSALVEGRPADEVAHEHDTTAAAVYKIKQRIRDRLRERIRQQLREEEFSELRSEAS